MSTGKRHSLKWLTSAGLCLALAGCGDAPDLAAIQRAHPPSSAWLLDRHGEVMQEVRVDFRVRRGAWQPLAAISPALPAAVVRFEDKRFREHGGVDLAALGHAAWQNLIGEKRRGASTLTMQLAGFLEPELASGAHKTWWGKLRQMLAAWRLERTLDKAQILEAYLNLAPFRGEARGVAAASAMLFGKGASALSRDEALLLAALLPAPQAGAEAVAARACRGARLAVADCTRLMRLAQAAFAGQFAHTRLIDDAPHLAARLALKPGERVRTTLDAGLQRRVRAALGSQLATLEAEDVEDGAVLVLDNASGDVLAYVGSRRGARQHFVDGVRAPRQAGSTLKPFLYTLAIEQGVLTAASQLDDSAVAITTPSGQYVPQNYDRRFRGRVSVRTSLAGSLNVPAVRTLLLVGLDPFRDRLLNLGLPLAQEADFYGYALALGSPEVDLWSLTNAYRTLANGGRGGDAHVLPQRASDGVRVFDPAAAFVVSDILADRAARSVTFGLENPLATPFWSAVKTGTSKDMRDNWCVGYSRRVTVGVWVGNFDGRPMRGVSGVTGAAPVWLDVMQMLPPAEAGSPTPPSGLVRQQGEWFLAGGAPSDSTASPAESRIAYPGDGAILALDPDIPPAMQRVYFESTAGNDAAFFIDGQRVGAAKHPVPWTPVAGPHVLELRAERDGRVLDGVRFQVRGKLETKEPAARAAGQ
ncbi:MAG: penicillin-binding protein 1C [Pseudomonadota bacterium]